MHRFTEDDGLTKDQYNALRGMLDNEPFDSAFTEGHYEYERDEHGIKDSRLDALVRDYKRASDALKQHLKRIGVW